VREFHLSDGEVIKFGPHLERQISKRKMELQRIKETIENPDIVIDDKHDSRGRVYKKEFTECWYAICLNESKNLRFAKTAWKEQQ